MFEINGEFYLGKAAGARLVQCTPETFARHAAGWGIKTAALPARRGLLYRVCDIQAIAAGSRPAAGPTREGKTARGKRSHQQSCA